MPQEVKQKELTTPFSDKCPRCGADRHGIQEGKAFYYCGAVATINKEEGKDAIALTACSHVIGSTAIK